MPELPGKINPPTEMGMEKRLLIAFALMMLVLVGAQYWFKPAPAPKAVEPSSPKQVAAQAAKPKAPPVVRASAPTTAAATAAPVAAAAEATEAIDTELYHIVFTNKGAVVKSWILKRVHDSAGKPLDVVNIVAKNVPKPFSLEPVDQKLLVDPNQVLYVATPTADHLGIAFEYSGNGISIRKSFHFAKDSYLSEVRSEVLQNDMPVPCLLVWRGGFGDQEVRNAAGAQLSVHFNETTGKLITKSAKDAKNGPISDSGNFTFGGMEDAFFAEVAMPINSASMQVRTFSDDVTPAGEDKAAQFAGAGFATGAQNQVTLFVGPKDTDLLRKINPKLDKLIDWGFFGILAKPLFLCLNWVNDHWTFNYGWAIILVTVIINLLLFPFKLSQLKSSRKMQALQPRIKALNDRFKGVGISDPRKADQNKEMMAMYKEAGVNPLGGCLPMILQLPFFYAFYRVLAIAFEMRGASWLWVPNLSQPETLPIHILPLILVATQFLMQKMTPTAGVDPNQQKMMMFMPLIFGFMFYYASAGLVIYWLTGNVVGVAQQALINRMTPALAPAPAPAVVAPAAPVRKAPEKKSLKK